MLCEAFAVRNPLAMLHAIVATVLQIQASKQVLFLQGQTQSASKFRGRQKKPGPDFSRPGFSPMKHKTSEPGGWI